MEQLHEPKSEALRTLYWRDEILQVMFWIKGEGLGDQVDPALLERFLGIGAELGRRYLDGLVEEGLLRHATEGHYSLTEEGNRFGGKIFADEFAELTRSGHGECGPDCWCHASPEEAEACLADRHPGTAGDHV
ncbi:MAG: hypothetical protein ABJC60_04115 [Actinomycetota bacterium]